MLALAETKPRDHVILLLMSDAGLRRGEVISLRVRDVDLTGKMLRLRGKGGHDRVVPLTGELHALLKSLCRGKALDESVVGVKDKAVYQTVNLMNRLLLLEVSPVAG
jgi:integrase